jgi:hypothetical protein
MPMPEENKWKASGSYQDSRKLCEYGADVWRERGYEIKIKKTADGWKHFRRKKIMHIRDINKI